VSTFLIGYDIADPRRLQQVHKVMLRHAAPIEYSIFLLDGSEADVALCLREVEPLMEAREDDVRCYPLPVRGLQTRIGRACLPAGIVWTGLPTGICVV
jgi:CRISPR-associated protein Cas2